MHITFAHISLAEATHMAMIPKDRSLGEPGNDKWKQRFPYKVEYPSYIL